MSRAHPLRVKIKSDRDAFTALEAVQADSVPRVLERDGAAVAAIVSMDDFERLQLASPSAEGIARALRAMGGWKDLGGELLATTLGELRHGSPDRPAVRL